MTQQDHGFANDLIISAEGISEFMYGSPTKRRRVYHLIATSNLPVFKIGSVWHARKSVLLKWIEDQERRHAGLVIPKSANGNLGTVRG
jgi:hypothetical protein